MDDNLIGKLRTGQSATFIIFQTPEEGIGFPDQPEGLRRGLRQAALRALPTPIRHAGCPGIHVSA